jgi:hypothetical protein
VSFTRQRRRSFLSLFPSFIHQNEPARVSVSLFLLEKKEKPKQKKRFHLFSVCDSEPRKHTDRTTKKGAPETFHINNNTLSTQTTHNALSRHHFRIWWEKHEDEDDDDDDDAQRGGCDERSFIRRRRRRPRRKRRRASFFTIIEKKK